MASQQAPPSYYLYIYSWSFKNSWAPHCCSSSCLSSLFWTSTPLKVNTIDAATMCVNIALNYYFISLKNHKGSTIIWIVNFFSFLSSIPCKVSMFKTWFKLMSQKSFCKLGLCFTTHYQWQWNDKKEIRVYIWFLWKNPQRTFKVFGETCLYAKNQLFENLENGQVIEYIPGLITGRYLSLILRTTR
jgi:hypothetical protein